MDNLEIANELRAVIAEIDQVRRGIMADEPRRRTYLLAVKAQRTAENLFAQTQSARRIYQFAAE